MRRTITFSVDAKGRRTELVGIDANPKDHKVAFANAKIGVLPKGVVAVEQWEMTRRTTGIDLEAQKRRLNESEKPDGEVPGDDAN